MRNAEWIRLLVFGLCLLGLPAPEAAALSLLAGPGSVTQFFDPNASQPRLQMTGDDSLDSEGQVAVFNVALGEECDFDLVIDFMDGLPPDSYSNLLLSVALADGVDYSGVSITAQLGGQTATLFYDAGVFTSAASFGLPGSIAGIGDGGFLNVNEALVAAFDLETDLTRGINDPLVVRISVSGLSDIDQLVRFDAFGFGEDGKLIVGNNPNPGGAGVRPVPEPAAVALYLAGLAVAGVTLRRQLTRRA